MIKPSLKEQRKVESDIHDFSNPNGPPKIDCLLYILRVVLMKFIVKLIEVSLQFSCPIGLTSTTDT